MSRTRAEFLDALENAGWVEREGFVASPNDTVCFMRNPNEHDGWPNTAPLPELLEWLRERNRDIAKYQDHPDARKALEDGRQAESILAGLLDLP